MAGYATTNYLNSYYLVILTCRHGIQRMTYSRMTIDRILNGTQQRGTRLKETQQNDYQQTYTCHSDTW